MAFSSPIYAYSGAASPSANTVFWLCSPEDADGLFRSRSRSPAYMFANDALCWFYSIPKRMKWHPFGTPQSTSPFRSLHFRAPPFWRNFFKRLEAASCIDALDNVELNTQLCISGCKQIRNVCEVVFARDKPEVRGSFRQLPDDARNNMPSEEAASADMNTRAESQMRL